METKKISCQNVNGYCSVCLAKIPFDGFVCEGPRHHTEGSFYPIEINKNHKKVSLILI